MFISNIRTHQPLIENWELIFPKIYGEGNHQKMAKAFHTIWNSSEIEELIFNRDDKGLIREQISENKYRIITSGELEIAGTIYGYSGHIQGFSILIDKITSIARIKDVNGNYDWSSPLLITTRDGKQYRIYAKDCTDKTGRELSDITMFGEVKTRTDY
jgi:hypothetical protein